MIRQSGEDENQKIQPKIDSKRTDESPTRLLSIGTPGDDEIDPADFFDPEEFGYRRDRKLFRR